jgi:intracellular multiplication protein IcmK
LVHTSAKPIPDSITTVNGNKNNDNIKKEEQEEQADKQPTIRDEAFKQLLNKTLPLRPDQIIELHKELDKSQQAVQTMPTTPPQPMSSTLTVDLSPGTTPPVIRLATGFVTSIVFVYATGQPWPVVDYSLGNPKNFNIQWDKKTNSLFIQSTAAYVTANLAVRLAELDTPIMISLVTGQREVDYRIDLQIRAHGPNALAPIVNDNLPNSTSASLLSVLDGIPPHDSIELKVSGEYGRAWLYNNKLIFRTKLTLLSPAWTSSISSPDGTRVYELMKTPLILASQNGKPIKIELTGM